MEVALPGKQASWGVQEVSHMLAAFKMLGTTAECACRTMPSFSKPAKSLIRVADVDIEDEQHFLIHKQIWAEANAQG